MIAGLLQSRDLPGLVDWHLTYFRDPAGYPVPRGPLPASVESVVNAVTIDRRRFCAGVSGGVSVETRALVQPQAVCVDDYGRLEAYRAAATASAVPADSDLWWWN